MKSANKIPSPAQIPSPLTDGGIGVGGNTRSKLYDSGEGKGAGGVPKKCRLSFFHDLTLVIEASFGVQLVSVTFSHSLSKGFLFEKQKRTIFFLFLRVRISFFGRLIAFLRVRISFFGRLIASSLRPHRHELVCDESSLVLTIHALAIVMQSLRT
jgi:hypothetical protein